MGYIATTGFAAFHFDSKNDVRRSLALMDSRCRLVGNINNPRTLLFGTPAEVESAVHDALDAGLMMVGPECALPLACPLENLRMIPQAVATWLR
jgi:[methyl-Co(III) methanol-specific corrinoid protein]:coenzyme M methyltransferase